MTGLGAAPIRQVWPMSTRPTANPSARSLISPGFKGVLQVDGYGGYSPDAKTCPRLLLGRMCGGASTSFGGRSGADCQRALARITDLYAVEKEIRGRTAEERRAVWREKSKPILELEPWLRTKLDLISQKTKLAEAIRYAFSLAGALPLRR